jgi:hypothetical protein
MLCEVCQGEKFQSLADSVLFSRYPFLTPKNLRYCVRCGAKYQICDQCQTIVNRVHLSLDPFFIQSSCPKCQQEFDQITHWIKFRGKIPHASQKIE